MTVNIIEKARNIFWGWYVVFSAFTIMIITYGARYSFGVFVKPMFVEYDWPMTIISLAVSINMAVYAVTGIFTGRLLDKIAPKWVMTIGITLSALGFISASFIKTPLGLYLSFGVLYGIGAAGSGHVVSCVTVGKWFIKKRGLAIGITTVGIGVGTVILAPIAGYIVKNFGWRNGFLFIGLLTFVVGITMAQIFMGKTDPEREGLLPDGEKPDERCLNSDAAPPHPQRASLKPVLRDSRFWILVCCNVLAVMTVMMTFVHQVAYAINAGIDKLEAAAAIGVIGITGSIGKFFFGWFNDRIKDAKYSASLGLFLMAVSMFILYKANTVGVLYVFALIYGFGYGSLAPVMPYLVSDRFGRHTLGTVFGLMNFFATGVGGGLGPILGGVIYDKTGSYAGGWILNLIILLFVSGFILALKPASKTPVYD